jgi:glycosyl transferase family 25
LVFDPDRNQLSKPEIGATLSHLGIYRDMMEKNIPMALILEDDVVFNLDPRPVLDGLARQPADAPDVFLLTNFANRYIDHGKPRQIGGLNFFRAWDGSGANGHVITRKAAANIRHYQTPIKGVCDWWKLFQTNDLIRLYVCEKEFISSHPELASASLCKDDRGATWGRARKKYVRRVRNQTPLRLRVKYFFFRLRHGHNLRRQ